ncbi:hypothetical protein ACJX0J_016329, partial [Zea mays]
SSGDIILENNNIYNTESSLVGISISLFQFASNIENAPILGATDSSFFTMLFVVLGDALVFEIIKLFARDAMYAITVMTFVSPIFITDP